MPRTTRNRTLIAQARVSEAELSALREAGLEVTRQGKDYITAADPGYRYLKSVDS